MGGLGRVTESWVKFCSPVDVGGVWYRGRPGFWITITTEDGRSGVGEITIFPYSENKIRDVRNELSLLNDRIEWDGLPAFSPEVQWGIRSAFWDLAADIVSERLKSARLLWQPCDGWLSELSNWNLDSADAVIKVKMGRGELQSERDALVALIQSTPFQFRLDSNMRWTLDECLTILTSIDLSRIDFIEDPTDNPSDAVAIFQQTGVTIAADEWSIVDGVGAVVLKPSRRDIAFIPQEKRIILSSNFESESGMMALGRAISYLGLGAEYHGLDTYRWVVPVAPLCP